MGLRGGGNCPDPRWWQTEGGNCPGRLKQLPRSTTAAAAIDQGMEPSTAEECELTSSLSASSLHEELCAFIQEVEKAQRDDASFSTEAALTSMAGGNKENVAAVLSTMEQNAHSMMAQGIMEPALGSQLFGWVRPINQIIFLPFLPAVGADTH